MTAMAASCVSAKDARAALAETPARTCPGRGSTARGGRGVEDPGESAVLRSARDDAAEGLRNEAAEGLRRAAARLSTTSDTLRQKHGQAIQ